MSKADEEFEKLGYEKITDSETEIKYHYEERLMGDKCTCNILFAKVSKIVFNYGEYMIEARGIGMKELEAINMKCKELGWIE